MRSKVLFAHCRLYRVVQAFAPAKGVAHFIEGLRGFFPLGKLVVGQFGDLDACVHQHLTVFLISLLLQFVVIKAGFLGSAVEQLLLLRRERVQEIRSNAPGRKVLDMAGHQDVLRRPPGSSGRTAC